MTDLLLTEGADIALARGDLVLDTGLGSAVLRSVFTDRRATAEELARVGTADPRGWWGEDPSDRWGSGLWLLAREVQTAETLARAREYVRAALRWLIDDGVAQSVEVAASYPASGELRLEVRVIRGRAKRWAHVWRSTTPAVLSADRVTLAVLLEGGTP
jgi:phage gp46-like protein